MYLVYKTDKDYTYFSSDLIGLCTQNLKPLTMVRRYIKENRLPELSKDQIVFFDEFLRTFEYDVGEFMAVEIHPNELVEVSHI